jgi:hypothetical protein
MAFVYTKNQSVLNEFDVVFKLKTALKASGWVVKSSSDGTTYNATGDQITSSGTGAGGLKRLSAWFRIQSPAGAGGREFLFQVDQGTTSGWVGTISYSASAGFSGGTPDATNTPTATDAVSFASGVWGYNANGAGGTIRCHVIVDNAAPYGWAVFTYVPGGGHSGLMLVCDPMVSGTTETGDVDQVVLYNSLDWFSHAGLPGDISSIVTTNTESNNFGKITGWHAKGLTGAVWANHIILLPLATGGASLVNGALTGTSTTNVNALVDAYALKDNLFPCVYARYGKASGTITGVKGVSTFFKTTGQNGRMNGDTYTTAGVRDRIVCGHVTLPWDGTIPT